MTALKQTHALDDFNPGSNIYIYIYSSGDISTAEGTLNAYLVDSAQLLEVNTDADVKYLMGTQLFTTPVVITDASTTMNASFKTTTGIRIFDNGTDSLQIVNGPFSLKLTVE